MEIGKEWMYLLGSQNTMLQYECFRYTGETAQTFLHMVIRMNHTMTYRSTHIIIVTEPPNVLGRDLNRGALSFEASALLTELSVRNHVLATVL